MAIAHAVKPTGYKAKNAYGGASRFDGGAAAGTANASSRRVGEGGSAPSRYGDKKLVPYHPLAPRNRPKSQVENVVGSRFAIPKGFAEKYRNSSRVCFGGGGGADTWKTTNQAYSQPSGLARRNTGMDNVGIFAERAAMIHAKQRV